MGRVGVGVNYGYPAWAGIDRGWTGRRRRSRRLPRVGGDRPMTDKAAGLKAGVTPRGRG